MNYVIFSVFAWFRFFFIVRSLPDPLPDPKSRVILIVTGLEKRFYTVNLTETAIRALKAKRHRSMSGATALNVALDDLVSKFSLLAARFSISAITWKKGKRKIHSIGYMA